MGIIKCMSLIEERAISAGLEVAISLGLDQAFLLGLDRRLTARGLENKRVYVGLSLAAALDR
jgi:hypothetical protein